jgi:hypothetical protein
VVSVLVSGDCVSVGTVTLSWVRVPLLISYTSFRQAPDYSRCTGSPCKIASPLKVVKVFA